MVERPILFSGPMVRALLDGSKTQTRRVVVPQPPNEARWVKYTGDHEQSEMAYSIGWFLEEAGDWWPVNRSKRTRCPYGQPGDLLWVRETWRCHNNYDGMDTHLVYVAMDGDVRGCIDFAAGHRIEPWWGGWRPSTNMPKWASRIWLRVIDVRVERLQSITPEDCGAEGIEPEKHLANWCVRLRPRFQNLWDSLNAKRGFGWGEDPWVWRIAYERTEAP